MVTYIYALVDPRTDEIRYIGKSNNPRRRLSCHVCVAPRLQHHRARWIKELLKMGLRPYVKILEETTEGIWQDREKWWIAKLKAEGANLVNETDGGDGAWGLLEERRLKIVQTNKNRVWTQEMREKSSKSHRGVTLPPEQRERIAATLRGRKRPKELMERIGRTKKGRKLSAEMCIKLAKAHSHLSDDSIREIRQMVSNGICHRIIAEKFNTSDATVCRIAKRRVYGWVE